jgi:hypothetical protein
MRAQEAATSKKMNALSVIFPYRLEGVWVFDDAAIGIGGQSGKWKDGCVRPSSSISKALPKRFSCRRPSKAREIRRWDPKEHAFFPEQPAPSTP